MLNGGLVVATLFRLSQSNFDWTSSNNPILVQIASSHINSAYKISDNRQLAECIFDSSPR